RDCDLRNPRAGRHAASGRGVHRSRGTRHARDPVPCPGVRTLPVAADVPHGRFAAAAARWIESSPEGVSWMGFLYGSNTVGAVFGCLLAGFYLLRVHDMAFATF